MLNLIIVLIVVGVLLWLVNTYIPMDGTIKKIINVVVIICVVLYLMRAFGVWSKADSIKVPQVKQPTKDQIV